MLKTELNNSFTVRFNKQKHHLSVRNNNVIKQRQFVFIIDSYWHACRLQICYSQDNNSCLVKQAFCFYWRLDFNGENINKHNIKTRSFVSEYKRPCFLFQNTILDILDAYSNNLYGEIPTTNLNSMISLNITKMFE